MLRALRNLAVNLMAVFIWDRNARHKFRNKYKRKSKFRKLRDDNKRLFLENQSILNKLAHLEKIINETRSIDYGWPPVIKQLEDITVTSRDRTIPVYLSIACISKNEGPYLKEWIEYHKLVGVERFYFYDNESDDNTREILDPYIIDGTVVYHYVPGRQRQFAVYNDAVLRYADETFWLAIIDLDEFIVPKEKDSVADFLKDYEKYHGVGINWVLFDSNGHQVKPTAHGGLVTANYMRVNEGYDPRNKIPRSDRIIKSIIQPPYVSKFINPHFAIFKGGLRTVNENFEPIFGSMSSYCSKNKIQLNHYHFKSKDEYIKKCKRGAADTNKYVYDEKDINFIRTLNDYAIQKYMPKLKAALGIVD